jgi:nucleoside-diphosphate-sugar epimerase
VLALVTGGTGFVGQHLVRALRAADHEVICVVRSSVNTSDDGISILQADIRQPGLTEAVVSLDRQVDVFFHLAATMPTPPMKGDLARYMEGNGVGTARLLDAAVQLGASAFVYASSIGVIGRAQELPVTEEHPVRPEHPYFVGKLSGEMMCDVAQAGQMRAISLRITSPYGPEMNQSTILPRFVKRALASEDLRWWGSGRRRQNFVHVCDVVRACLRASESNCSGRFNIGGPESIGMSELAEMVRQSVSGTQSKAFGDGSPDPQEGYSWDVCLLKAESALDHRPTITLREGLRDYVRYVGGEGIHTPWFTTV